MEIDYQNFTIRGLYTIARNRGLRRFSRLSKAQLIERLRNQGPIVDTANIDNIRQPDDELRRLTMKDLRNIAKSRGMGGFTHLRKDQLITRLRSQEKPILDRDNDDIKAPILTPKPYVPPKTTPKITPETTPETPRGPSYEEILKSLKSDKKAPRSISPKLKALRGKISEKHRRQNRIDIKLVSTAHDGKVRKYIGKGPPFDRILGNSTLKSIATAKEFLLLAKESVIKILSVNRGRKVKMNIEAYMYRLDIQPDEAVPAHFHSDINEINSKETDLYKLYDKMSARIMVDLIKFLQKDSGWLLRNISEIVLHTAVYDPLKAEGHIPLPKWIESKKVVINMQNKDDKYFLWCVLRWLNPVDKHAYRVDKVLKEKENSLKMDGIKYPVSCNDIDKFEKQNPEISVNVFEYTEKKNINRIRATKKLGSNHVNLLYIEEGEKSHYALIKKFRGLMRDQIVDNGGTEYCMLCLNHFGSKTLLEKHMKYCNGHKPFTLEMPEKGNTIKFINHSRKLPVPFVVYADFESVLSPINTCQPNPKNSYTTPILRKYTGENAEEKFAEFLTI